MSECCECDCKKVFAKCSECGRFYCEECYLFNDGSCECQEQPRTVFPIKK